MSDEIPEVVILRLPLYVRVLSQLESRGIEVASSQVLGDFLQISPALVRKDLHYFGRFGTQGQGYQVRQLKNELRQILGLDRTWTMALVGVGQLGTAILSYGGFQQQGFHIVAAFDADPARVGSRAGDLIIQDVRELQETVRSKGIAIGIVAVPAAAGQGVADALVASGIRGILNYAPFRVHVPPSVWVRDVDPVVVLQSITFHLKAVCGQRPVASLALT
ncbi:MAG: redox-sensing transcriptional repressor Rex [Chloroflexi bacterium]|nr:redox-sensing transcriptional repressor Rex [Chloroflexota bacterium]